MGLDVCAHMNGMFFSSKQADILHICGLQESTITTFFS